jgi:hypothetical protein
MASSGNSQVGAPVVVGQTGVAPLTPTAGQAGRGPTAQPAPGVSASLHPGFLNDPTVLLLVVFLAFPLLLVSLLALRPQSGFRHWFGTSLSDFRGLFTGLGDRRHRIHDKPYLDRVLEAEFGERRSGRRRSRRSAGTRSEADSSPSRSSLRSSSRSSSGSGIPSSSSRPSGANPSSANPPNSNPSTSGTPPSGSSPSSGSGS